MLDRREVARQRMARAEWEMKRRRIVADSVAHAKGIAEDLLSLGLESAARAAREQLPDSREERLWLEVEGIYAAEIRRREKARRDAEPKHPLCGVCGCRHDPQFTQIIVGGRRKKQLGAPENPIRLNGVLPEIFGRIHHAHAHGLNGLKTAALRELLLGYGEHPSKAFYDLHQVPAYRLLFVTGKPRGVIKLRFAPAPPPT